MFSGYARRSILLLAFSIFNLIAITIFESVLVGASQGTQRLVTLVMLVLPPFIGFLYGVQSLRTNEPQRGLAIAGTLLNALFGLFHIVIVFFAG
jgi:hypothetical protein